MGLLALVAPGAARADDPIEPPAPPAPPPVAAHSDPSKAFDVPAGEEPVAPRFPGFSTPWCGTPRASDDQANETGSLADAKIHLVYAHPLGSPDNFAAYANAIQGDINAI